MLNPRSVFVPALLLLLSCSSTALVPQSKAPDFSLNGDDGRVTKASSLWNDRSVLFVFMTTWCHSCRAEAPILNELVTKRPVVAITTGNTLKEVAEFRRTTGARYPILLDDGRVASAYGIQSTPTFVEIGRGGALLHRASHLPKEQTP